MQKRTSVATRTVKKVLIYAGIFIVFGIGFSYYELINAENSAYSQIAKSAQNLVRTKQMAKARIGLISAVTVSKNQDIVRSLKTKDRQLAVKVLQGLVKAYKAGTPFKNIKFHIHTADVHSFVRAWKPKKFGDDLSGFRKTIVAVRDTKKTVRAIEVGRAGLVVRGLAPIFDNDGTYLGSIEMIQGLNSVVKSLKKEKTDLLVLLDGKYKRGNALTAEQKVQNYYLSQKTVNNDFNPSSSSKFNKPFI